MEHERIEIEFNAPAGRGFGRRHSEDRRFGKTLALAVIAWIISGGLRRRMKGNPVTIIPAVIIMAQPPRQPEPPIVDIEVEQTWNDDDEMTD